MCRGMCHQVILEPPATRCNNGFVSEKGYKTRINISINRGLERWTRGKDPWRRQHADESDSMPLNESDSVQVLVSTQGNKLFMRDVSPREVP